jgi:CheY-like chemotaxis protein
VIFQTLTTMAKRIVIADDSVTIQKAFAMTFAGEDVTLMSARSADEGLSMARQVQADLVIADGVMPGRSGYELCTAIKSDPGLQRTAVYILTSSHQPYDDALGRQSGADGHILKPFETNAIIEKVRDALAKGPSPDARPTAPTPAFRPSAPSIPAAPRPSVAAIPMGLSPPSDDDEYGEMIVDMPSVEPPRPELSSAVTPIPSAARPLAPPGFGAPSHAPAAASSHPPAAGMRPSLIPGLRPGTVPMARPGTQPVRTLGPGAAPPSRPPAPVSRTLVGLPAANVPIPGSTRTVPPSTARPPTMAPVSPPRPVAPAVHAPFAPVAPPSAPIAAPPSAPAAPAPSLFATPAPRPTSTSVVSSIVDQKIAAIAAKGPEYEAIAKLSREVIEQIVWEIVPELAEAIIREHVEKRGLS